MTFSRAFQFNAFQNDAFQVEPFLVSTDILQLPVDCVLAGQQEQYRKSWREYEIAPRNEKRRGVFNRSGVSRLGNSKPAFTVRTDNRGYN